MNYDYEIKRCVDDSDFYKGKRISRYDITEDKKIIKGNETLFYYSVESQSSYRDYSVIIQIINHNVTGHFCNCMQYNGNHSCKHVAAVLINYYETMINYSPDDYIKSVSKSIINSFNSTKNKTPVVKKEVGLELEIEKEYYGIRINPKIGIDKKYIIRTKLRDFVDAYKHKTGEVVFGTKFTYNPEQHYFNKKNEEIINFIKEQLDYSSSLSEALLLSGYRMKAFLNIIKDYPFLLIGFGKIYGIKEGTPFNFNLTKSNDLYILDLNLDDLNFLDNSYEYVAKDGYLYHISSEYQKFFNLVKNRNMNQLIFDKKELASFKNKLLPIIKHNLEIDKSVDNIIISKKPDCSLYFDLNYNDIICNLKLNYNGIELDYFDKSHREIIRDYEYENIVLEDLFKANFEIIDNKLKLEDIDNIGVFLDETIHELGQKYDVFTSEKLKQIEVVKNTNVTSSFSIGKDNIMRFEFDLGDIDNTELDDILKNLKAKKKYFKLKSGNYLNLNDNNIQELNDLIDDIDITSKDLKNGNGIIPKYRAIYLDSLKGKYDIIKTNGLFNDFINNFKEFRNAKIVFNSKEKQILRDYQETGVKWLYNICKCDFGGILADEMGLGKSIQVIYLIKKLLKEDKDSKFLIVSPTSLVYNWENEFKKFGAELNYQTFGESKKIRHEKLENTDCNVYITSYGLLREDFEIYKNLDFDVCIIDEAQNIKNPNAGITKTVKDIKAKTRLALTGTPIENSAIELWSIFDYCMPGFLGGQQEFSRKYNVKEFDENTNKKLQNLNKLINPFVLRRKKQDVLNDLPDKIENNIFIELSDMQKGLYAKEVDRVNKEFDEILQTEGISKARFLILQLLIKLRQLCIDPRILYDNYQGGSNKIDTLISITKEYIANGHKILLFTSFKTALELVRKEYEKEGISTYTIDGSVGSKKRMELVENFNKNDTNVFLIMLKSGGTGLNLTSADVVIHLDLWWNPQAENQATDRAHRIGQKNNVEVIKLVSKGTIEEKILALQEKKKLLSDKVIEGEDMDKDVLSKLTEKELRDLLSYENKEIVNN